ncbi:hypothetical protein FBR05_03845 [Deltaproteobacteria bacterium PRO3]|nr:hypothetical protein [Deltaproteobacteria bacterium PRO3]
MDPISAGLTQSALQNIGGAGTQLPSQGTGAGGFQTDKTSFSQLLDNTIGAQSSANSTSNAKLLEFVESFGNDSIGGNMKSIPAGEIQIDVARAGEIEKSSAPKSTGIFEIFKEVNSNQMGMEQLMEQMFSGSKKSWSALELTRMQMYAHHSTVNMEVISKVGEMANKAISTPFNMQVG